MPEVDVNEVLAELRAIIGQQAQEIAILRATAKLVTTN
jgi:hypothetical protein